MSKKYVVLSFIFLGTHKLILFEDRQKLYRRGELESSSWRQGTPLKFFFLRQLQYGLVPFQSDIYGCHDQLLAKRRSRNLYKLVTATSSHLAVQMLTQILSSAVDMPLI